MSKTGGSMAQPFYCPYCGEQDFEPAGDEAGQYACNSCNRYFVVKFLGLGALRAGEPASREPE